MMKIPKQVHPHIAIRKKHRSALGLTQCPICKATFGTEHACTVHLFHRYSKCKIPYSRHLLAEKQRHLEVRCTVQVPGTASPNLDSSDWEAIDDSLNSIDIEIQEALPYDHSSPVPAGEDLFDPTRVSDSRDKASPAEEHDEDLVIDKYDGAAKIIGKARSTFSKMYSQDKYASHRQKNPFYPFSCFTEWEIAHWLAKAGLSQDSMNDFFKLKYVCTLF